jgi:hypothetical protein
VARVCGAHRDAGQGRQVQAAIQQHTDHALHTAGVQTQGWLEGGVSWRGGGAAGLTAYSAEYLEPWSVSQDIMACFWTRAQRQVHSACTMDDGYAARTNTHRLLQWRGAAVWYSEASVPHLECCDPLCALKLALSLQGVGALWTHHPTAHVTGQDGGILRSRHEH